MNAKYDWLNALRRCVAEFPELRLISVEGLEVALRSVDPAPSSWVLKYLQPLSLSPPQDFHRRYTVNYVYSDDILLEAARSLADAEFMPDKLHNRSHRVTRARPSPNVVVYCDAHEGLVWVSDLAADSIFIVVSSRTRLPALEFASLTRQLVTRYLEEQDWTLFHAGAVSTPSGALLLVGNAGAGKTSLLLALLCGGANYISNERVFVRRGNGAFHVLASPMAVAIGLGTAMQFPALAHLIGEPDRLQYPRRRFSSSRIAETPRHKWQELDDKLQVLPGELTELLEAPQAMPGGELRAIVVPSVSKGPAPVLIQSLSQPEANKILANNLIGRGEDGGYPPWIEMAFRPNPLGEKDRLVEELSVLSAVRFGFGLTLQGLPQTRTYAGKLLAALGGS